MRIMLILCPYYNRERDFKSLPVKTSSSSSPFISLKFCNISLKTKKKRKKSESRSKVSIFHHHHVYYNRRYIYITYLLSDLYILKILILKKLPSFFFLPSPLFMAVQAHHHPSTLFFLNRNGQEGNDCSNQPHKSQFQSINAGVDTRKRAREDSSVIDLEITAAPMNPPPQILGRRQNPNVVSTGLRLSHGQSSNQDSSFQMITRDLSGEFKRQSDELDRFLQIQGEQLRCMLAENSERHYRELLRTTEESVRRRLREKETEIEKATRRHAELEARAAQIEMEARAWQVRAAAREAEATSLQARLQQAVVAHGGGVTTTEPKSGSVDGVDEAEDAESAYVDPDRIEVIGPECKICRRSATVLVLPCRHLVLCKGCDGSVRVCPLCLSSKNSSVEVFFS